MISRLEQRINIKNVKSGILLRRLLGIKNVGIKNGVFLNILKKGVGLCYLGLIKHMFINVFDHNYFMYSFNSNLKKGD